MIWIMKAYDALVVPFAVFDGFDLADLVLSPTTVFSVSIFSACACICFFTRFCSGVAGAIEGVDLSDLASTSSTADKCASKLSCKHWP